MSEGSLERLIMVTVEFWYGLCSSEAEVSLPSTVLKRLEGALCGHWLKLKLVHRLFNKKPESICLKTSFCC